MTDKNHTASNQDSILNLIEELSGQKNVLVIPRLFVQITGSINAALLLSQIIYWSDKSTIPGFKNLLVFAKTSEEFAVELGLGRTAFDNARQKLESLELIKTKTGGFSGRVCTFWQPLMKKISFDLQQAVTVNQSNELNNGEDYEKFLEDFTIDDENCDCTNSTDALPLNVQMERPLTDNEEQSIKPDCNVHEEPEIIAETCVSNTEITSKIKQETTTNLQPDNSVAGGSSMNSEGFKNSVQKDLSMNELADYIFSVNSNLNNDEAFELVKKLEMSLNGKYAVSKEQFMMILAFSAVTGYSDYLKTDEKGKVIRTIKERWIEPAALWVKKGISVENMRSAMTSAITDDMHKMLICPASYSPRVCDANKKPLTKTSHLDDEF
jgi:hypothetical protein